MDHRDQGQRSDLHPSGRAPQGTRRAEASSALGRAAPWAVLLAGCLSTPTSPAQPGAPIAGLTSITVSPASVSLLIHGSTPATQDFTATGRFADGHTEDLGTRATFTARDPALGTFAGRTFTSRTDHGGVVVIDAAAGGVAGQATISLKLQQSESDPGSHSLPPSPQGRFGGTSDVSRAPTLVYPNDGVLLPPNLRQLEFHFRPGAANSLFELSFQNDLTDVKVYLDCSSTLPGGCLYVPSDTAWHWIAETNRGGPPLAVTLRGTDPSGKAVGTSASLSINFTVDDIQGGIYYWTTTQPPAVMRFDFASRTQAAAEKFVGSETTGGNCIGCHALSHAGDRLVAAGGTPLRGQLLLMDVGRSRPAVPWGSLTERSLFEAWSPDDSQFVGVFGELNATNFNLHLFDGRTGALIGPIDVGADSVHPVTHPDWSLDGTRIAYTRVGQVHFDEDGKRRIHQEYEGAIETITASAGGWSKPTTLVPRTPGQNHYYPAFSPDSSFLVYNQSVCPGAAPSDDCDADADPSARLWAIPLTTGTQPVELQRANAPGVADGQSRDLTTSYPRWSPFSFQGSGEFAGKLNWISFSSRRQYGLRKPPPSSDGSGTSGLLLWMAAIDSAKVPLGSDPSHPAFALPFQNIATSNHLAQWTARVVPSVQ